MTYTQLAILSVFLVLLIDYLVLRTRLTTRKGFWTAYSIILFFQLITNWWLTSREIVVYNPDAIVGLRVAGAPIEDLIFGFAMILAVMTMWEMLLRTRESIS